MKSTLLEIMLVIAVISILASLLLRRARKPKVQFANIGEGTRENGRDSLIWDATNASTNAAALAAMVSNGSSGQGRFLFVKKTTDTDHITTCAAGDTPVGVAEDAYDSTDADVPAVVALLGATKGTLRVINDGTITSDGTVVTTGATGMATAYASSGPKLGRAYIRSDESTNAGDVLTIIPAVSAAFA